MTVAEFAVRRTGKVSDAVISRGGKEVARMHGEGPLSIRLQSSNDEVWELDPRVQGEVRPFSMSVTSSANRDDPVLTIRNHIFFHNTKAYLLTGIPEDINPSDHIMGKRHVNRLDNFPFSRLEDIDLETWGRLRRHRGVSVGTIDGLGLREFRVTISQELVDIGLPLAAASYLLYSTG